MRSLGRARDRGIRAACYNHPLPVNNSIAPRAVLQLSTPEAAHCFVASLHPVSRHDTLGEQCPGRRLVRINDLKSRHRFHLASQIRWALRVTVTLPKLLRRGIK